MRVLDVATLAQWVEAAPVNDSAQVGPDVVIDTRKVTPVSYTHLTLPTKA